MASDAIDLGHFCLSADPLARFDAAARAGFSGISLLWDEIAIEADRGASIRDYRRMLADAGLRPSLMEFVIMPPEGEEGGFRERAMVMAEATAELQCPYMLAITAVTPDIPFPIVADRAADLAEICANAGIRCAVEFVPFVTSVPDLDVAIRLLDAVDSDALGLLVDSMHFCRSGAHWTMLEGLAPERLFVVQVNDLPLERPSDDYGEECMTARLLPLDGEFDLKRFVKLIDKLAPDIPLMAEVVNRDLLSMTPTHAAEIIAEQTRRLLAFRN